MADKYTLEQIDEIFDKILLSIEEGDSLRKALKKVNVSSRTFYEWIKPKEDDEKLEKELKELRQKQYASACEERAFQIFEEILDIADDQEGDVYYDKDGNEKTNHNKIARSRLRVDSRKWMLAKMMPRKYGEKLDLTSDGEKLPNYSGPIVVKFTNFDSDETKDETL